MLQNDFFSHIENHHSKKLPFVVYRKPRANFANGILQKSDQIYTSKDFKDRGFIFAPFDNALETVLIPFKHSEHISCKLEILKSNKKNISSHQPDVKSKNLHLDLVKKGIDAIRQNALQKVVLSRCESVNLEIHSPITIFKKLIALYPNAFVYCWFHPKVGLWLGATPETLVQINGRRFKTMALAGTQSFHGTLDVEWKAKEREEQQFVTDFITERLKDTINELHISKPSTIKAGALLHLQSNISGIISTDLKDIVQKLHPTPAVCGLPVASSKQFITDNETYNREYYTGFLGELNVQEKKTRNTNRRNVENNAYAVVSNSSHLYVNLRCMQIKTDKALIYVGGGITKDSSEEKEWEETVSKAETMKHVLMA